MKYKITMFLSSLLLFLCLFYYWQRENEFQRQLERVELRAFIERNQDKDETMRTIMNVGGVAEVKEVATAEIIKMIRDDIGEGIEYISIKQRRRKLKKPCLETHYCKRGN
jgi:hypothetical protein